MIEEEEIRMFEIGHNLAIKVLMALSQTGYSFHFFLPSPSGPLLSSAMLRKRKPSGTLYDGHSHQGARMYPVLLGVEYQPKCIGTDFPHLLF